MTHASLFPAGLKKSRKLAWLAACSAWAKWKAENGRPINIPPEDWNPVYMEEYA
jgi:hypothetical protein